MKLIQCAIVSVLLGLCLFVLPAQAQTTVALQNNLNTAICLNDWNRAIDALQQLIGSDATSPQSRQQLVTFRYQLEDYRASGTQFDQSQNSACVAAIAASQNQPIAQQPSGFDWEGAQQAIVGARPAEPSRRSVSQVCTPEGRCFNNRGAMLRHQRSWEEGDGRFWNAEGYSPVGDHHPSSVN